MKHELVFVFGDRNVIMRTNDIADIAGQPWFREFVGLSVKSDKTNLSQEAIDKLAEAERVTEEKLAELEDGFYDNGVVSEPDPMPEQREQQLPGFRPGY